MADLLPGAREDEAGLVDRAEDRFESGGLLGREAERTRGRNRGLEAVIVDGCGG